MAGSAPPRWQAACIFWVKVCATGGLGGLFQLGIGALALARGISGRCEAKRVLQEVGEQAQNAVIDSSHMPLEQTPAERERLRSSAQAATSTVTVTGNQGLDSPPTNP
jgi:hypothetical protein